MKNKLFLFFCLFNLQLFCQIVVGVDTLYKSGPMSKRINLVIMGDGYTLAEIPQFTTNANTVANYLLNTPPFSSYKNYFNVYAIKCQSPQSGVTHPGTATDVTEPASPTLTVINNFDTRFDNYGVHRMIYSMDPSAIYSVLATSFPNYDQILILGNSTEYGGTGGAYGVSSIHPSSPEIVAHEMGHSFAGLADEYWAGPGYAAERPNMTADSNLVTNKWMQWLGLNGIGIYPYDTAAPGNAWYRPHQNCKMRYLNVPFCSVCKQTIIERIHSLTNPIDDYGPANTNPITYLPGQWFRAKFIKPSPNTLKRTWELNANLIASNVDSIQLNTNQLPAGNSLLLTVTDTTVLSKDAMHYNHTYSVLWWVSYTPNGIQQVSAQMEYAMFPNPASDRVNLSYNLLSDAEVGLSVTDMNGRVLIGERSKRETTGEYKKEIDTRALSPGNYILTLTINGQPIHNKFVIFK